MTAPEDLLRELAPQVLGAVLRRFGNAGQHFAAAEDAVQEALLAAALQWRESGTPENPRGWLIQVACRRFQDQLRSELARWRREADFAAQLPSDAARGGLESSEQADRDDTLILLFMCCHPALSSTSAIALTLRAVGGLTTAEIARAFLVPEATMAQRISRAKQNIRNSGVPFEMPADREQRLRLGSVLHVLYLIFNEGYAATSGAAAQREDLAREAIRLARTVCRALPEDAEASGLLALMLLTDARRLARVGADGDLIPLAQQDRARWDRAAIAEGVALLSRTLPRGSVGPYQLQAAIAAVHDEAASAGETDWPQILALYGLLQQMSDNPVVGLNRAVAAAMVHGPETGLALLATLETDSRLAGHHRLAAVRAHLHEMSGNVEAAIADYRAAAARAGSVAERNYLGAQAVRLVSSADSGSKGCIGGKSALSQRPPEKVPDQVKEDRRREADASRCGRGCRRGRR